MSGSDLPTSRRFPDWLCWTIPAIFFIAWAALWQHLNKAPLHWDDSWYLSDSLDLFDALKLHGLHGWIRAYLLHAQERQKAPLMCALPTPIYLLLGRNFKLAFLVNYLFVLLLFWSLYSIARKFWGRRVAFLALLVTGSLPQMFGLTTLYMVEYGLAAITVAAIWCLIQSEDLTRIRWVVLFSVLAGLGALQKIIFPLYVMPLFAWCIFRRIMNRNAPDSPSIKRTLAALILPAAIIAGPWYALNFRIAAKRAFFSGFSQQEADLYGTGNPFTAAAIKKYLVMLINEGIGAPYFCVAIAVAMIWIVLLISHRRRERSQNDKGGWLILALWAVPFLVFLFGHNKLARFTAPILPIFAILLAIPMSRIIESLGKRGWAITAVLLISAFGFLIQLCFQPLGPRRLVLGADPANPDDHRTGLHFLDAELADSQMYDPNPWPLEETLSETISFHQREPKKLYRVMTASDLRHFNYYNLQLAATQAQLPIDIWTSAYFLDAETLRAAMNKMDFLIIRENAEPGDPNYNKLQSDVMTEINSSGHFDNMPNAIRFPDGGTVEIFRNRSVSDPETNATTQPAAH
jgi:4-amino-4-deoxy-L-arabinose transferase-like glycosyltransferase